MIGRFTIRRPGAGRLGLLALVGLAALGAVALGYLATTRGSDRPAAVEAIAPDAPAGSAFYPRQSIDTSAFSIVSSTKARWKDGATLEEIAEFWREPTRDLIASVDTNLAAPGMAPQQFASNAILKSLLLNSDGDAVRAGEALDLARARVESSPAAARELLYTIIYCQGVTSLRRGENDNCVMCRGESSCILPIAAAAVHTKPEGSRAAVRHFTEYLERFPADLEVRWLLNIAHMTLGEHPAKVDPRFLISLESFAKSEFDIGRFRDVGADAGVNRRNEAGGAIMDDFDGDGRLDIVVTSFDPTVAMTFFHNKGDGTFEDRGESVGLSGQLGGLVCYQGDYNNDGRPDIFVPRGAWLNAPIRPSLLRNDGGHFTDVTKEAGLLDPVNSNSAAWADYDNDGHLDLFVACERQVNRLYHSKGDGTFEEVAGAAGVSGQSKNFSKGSTWIDYDNDGAPDLFINCLNGSGMLFRNRRDGTFSEVTGPMKIDGPRHGFSCWAFDYDNDGWLDLFATCYDRSLDDVVRGIIGLPHSRNSGRLFRNDHGRGFIDATREAGLELVYATMGSNFGDFDNDGFLDFYLATGEPSFATLIPNRMFKNVGGKRFAEITGSSGTGHLQKGHGVAIGDYDGDGDVDIFAETGGAVRGDAYHDVLFQNPGQGNRSLTVRLVGKKTNRSAFGARIKVVTAGKEPQTIHRHVSSGSSFGANPLSQTIGLARAEGAATLEVYWPTSGTTQTFRDIPAGQSIEITEFAETYRRLAPDPKLARK